MIITLFGFILFSVGAPDFVPQEIKCAVPKIIASIENSKDMNVLLDVWADFPNQCVKGDCCIDTSENQTEGNGYNWKCGNSAWEMRPYINKENDSSCWAEYVISFQTPLGYSMKTFEQDFKFVPWEKGAAWFRGKEYALYMSPTHTRKAEFSGKLSGRIGWLKIVSNEPMACVKREYKFHSGDSLVFCTKPKKDSRALKD
jgi:hypothetical protein